MQGIAWLLMHANIALHPSLSFIGRAPTQYALCCNAPAVRILSQQSCPISVCTEALLERGRNIMRLFEELDVPKDKYLLRIPATWEGIQAAKTLEAEGAATHIIMVYRCYLHLCVCCGGFIACVPFTDAHTLAACHYWVWC